MDALRIRRLIALVSIAGAILWGVLRRRRRARLKREFCVVSIAGAILWGVLLTSCILTAVNSARFQSQGRFFGGCCLALRTWRRIWRYCFNRRGDSLGGAALRRIGTSGRLPVSIAGAILWGVLRRSIFQWSSEAGVSIAGAILWGVLPPTFSSSISHLMFQSQGRFFGGCCA